MPDITPIVLPRIQGAHTAPPIASTHQHYLAGNESLRLRAWNVVTGAVVTVAVRFLKPTGELTWLTFTVRPTNNRAATTAILPIGAGIILNVSAYTTTGAVVVGQLFITLEIVVGTASPLLRVGTLLQGYVTTAQTLSWPGSRLAHSIADGGYARTVSGTVPAPGGQVTEVVPPGARWELMALNCRLNTSAAVANRQAMLYADVLGPLVFTSMAPGTTGASSTAVFMWGQGLTLDTVIRPSYHEAGIITGFPLVAGSTIGVIVLDMQAADQLLDIGYLVREWLEAA